MIGTPRPSPSWWPSRSGAWTSVAARLWASVDFVRPALPQISVMLAGASSRAGCTTTALAIAA